MTITIQKCSNVTVIGKHINKNCKATYDIDDARFYASVSDLADALGVTTSAVSAALAKEDAVCCGHRICFVSELLEKFDAINEVNRIRAEKAAAYDAENERRNAIAKAEADVQKCVEQVEDMRNQLSNAETALNHAKARLYELKNSK